MKRIVCAVVAALGLTFSVQADTFWMTGGDGSLLYKVDTATAAATLVGPSGVSSFYGAAFAPDGSLYGNTQLGTLATVNQTTGQATNVGLSGVTALPLEIDTAGNIYTEALSSPGLYKFNPATNMFAIVGSNGLASTKDLAFDSHGTLWAVDHFNQLWTINTNTGEAVYMKSITGVTTNIDGIAFAADGTLYATDYAPDSRLFTVNSSGFASPVGYMHIAYAVGGDIHLVPLPSAAWMGLALISGLAGANIIRRKPNG